LVTVTGMLAACGPANAACQIPRVATTRSGRPARTEAAWESTTFDKPWMAAESAVPGSFQERLNALLNGTGGEGIFQARSELLNAGGEVIEFTKGIPVVLACCSSVTSFSSSTKNVRRSTTVNPSIPQQQVP